MKKRSKRWKKWAVVLALVAAVGLPAAYFAGREGLKRRILGWREQGFAAARAGDPERAAELLGRYLRRRPGDREAVRAFLAAREVSELPNGLHLVESAAALRALLAEEPESLDDRRHLLDLYVRLDRRPEALDAADSILEKWPDPRTLELKTEVLVRTGDLREALAAADRWARVAPGELAPHMTRLSLRSRLGHPREAIVADAQRLREAAGDGPRFQLLQGYAHALVGDTADAAQWLRAAADHAKLSGDDAETLVEQFDALGMAEDSLALLGKLAAADARPGLRQALARRMWELGRWEQTVEVLKALDAADGSADATLIAFKADALKKLGKDGEAEACRAALAGRKQAAARAWTLVLRRTLDARATDDREVVAACRAALRLDPDNSHLLYHLGEARARMGELDLAVQAWRECWERNPGWNVPAVRLVEALLQKGRHEQAMDVAAAAARRDPKHAGSVIALARAWSVGVETGAVAQADELLKLVDELRKRLPGEEQTLAVHVQLLAQRGDRQGAARVALAAVGGEPRRPSRCS